jgi:hypothetical protein
MVAVVTTLQDRRAGVAAGVVHHDAGGSVSLKVHVVWW